MYKYVVRAIGWVFDDDWYNYDGEHGIEGVYDSKAAAIARIDYLNHVHFLGRVFERRPLQLNYNYSLNDDKFIDRDLLLDLIAKKLGVKKQELSDAKRGFIWEDISYLKKLSEKQVKDILEKLELSFFTYVELSSNNAHLYKFKRNSDLWSKYYEESYYGAPNDYYYFFDDRDDDHLRFVNTKLDCYYYAVSQAHDPITWQLSNDKIISGSIEELSTTPTLLSQVLNNSPNIKVFSKAVTPKEIMALDAVLTKPILIIEPVEIDALPIYNAEKNYFYKEIKKIYNLKPTNKKTYE